MPSVYLKDGGTVQVSLENLEDYLYENQEQIETRKKATRRPPVNHLVTCPSNK